MKKFRCKNDNCKQPILFEAEFIGTIKKICPKCKKMNIFIGDNLPIIEKFCNTEKLN